MCKVLQKSVDGKLAKFNCVDRGSIKNPKFKIQCNFSFQGKKCGAQNKLVSQNGQ